MPGLRRYTLLLFLFAALAPIVSAHAVPDSSDVVAIQHLMDRQASDWNRGNIETFATGYKNSPDILFVGRTVSRGYAEMLERYRKGYPTRAAMGTLTFTNLAIVPLDDRFATASGNFHLERTAAGGGDADGIFSLVYEKTSDGWKITRDHTTAFSPPDTKAASR